MTLQIFVTNIAYLVLIAPLIIFNVNKSLFRWKPLVLFTLFFLLYVFFLEIPRQVPDLKIIVSKQWNWSGKIYALFGSILFYIIFKKEFKNFNFVTFKQKNGFWTRFFYITGIIYLLAIGLSFFYKSETQSAETYLFQFTLPGLDEELAFRGIMLGLLSTILNSKIQLGSRNIGNPAVLITAILFAFGHVFWIDANWSINFNWFDFFLNYLPIGLLLGWMAFKSESIIIPILIHNLINTLPGLIFMLLM